jgi:hypothetical protein
MDEFVNYVPSCCSQSSVARFLLVPRTKTGKIFQMTIKYIKWSQNIPNGRKIDKIAIKRINIFNFYPKRDFWFENIPSGNPVTETISIC